VRRDTFGARPVFWIEHEGAVYSAPSLAQLLAASGMEGRLDTEHVASALLGPGPFERALIAGARELLPGRELAVGPGGRALVQARPALPRAAEITPDALAAALRMAVRRMAGDAAVALAGGLEAVALLALAGEVGKRNAYVLIDATLDPAEMEVARTAARRAGAELRPISIADTRLPDSFERAVIAAEAPLHDARAIVMHLFYSEVAAAGEHRALSATGADEVFLGNPGQAAALSAQLAAERSLAREVLREKGDPAGIAAPRGTTLEDDLRAGRTLLCERILPSWILPPEVGTATRAGMELALPYLDEAVATIGIHAPLDRLVHGDRGKVLLREALAPIVPDALRQPPRRVQLTAPLGGPRLRAKWLERYHAWLAPARVESLLVVDPTAVRRRFDEIARPDPDPKRAARLERLLMRVASLIILHEHFARVST
jgi:asparagine synthase (glutamine-hydrolysing)